MLDLGTWLLANGARKHEAGVWDCCTCPAQWAVDNGYADPMADWRGSYGDEDDGLAISADLGGLPTLFDTCLLQVGMSRRDGAAQTGDIGILTVAGAEAGAIFTGKRWAMVARRGLALPSVGGGMIAGGWCFNG